MLAALLYNVNRDTTKDPGGKDWLDFFPEHAPAKTAQTEEQMFDAMMLWARATERLKA
jgi:hypothetical protein